MKIAKELKKEKATFYGAYWCKVSSNLVSTLQPLNDAASSAIPSPPSPLPPPSLTARHCPPPAIKFCDRERQGLGREAFALVSCG